MTPYAVGTSPTKTPWLLVALSCWEETGGAGGAPRNGSADAVRRGGERGVSRERVCELNVCERAALAVGLQLTAREARRQTSRRS